MSGQIECKEKQEVFRLNAISTYEQFCDAGLHLTHEEVDVWLAKLELGEDSEPLACHA